MSSKNLCHGFTARGNKPCSKPARENGFCVSHGGIEPCLGVNERGGKRCGRPPISGTLYCAGHTKTNISAIDTSSIICQGTFKHGEKCFRQAQYKGLCGYHCKDVKSSDLNIPKSDGKCSVDINCLNHKLINGVCTDHQCQSFYNELVDSGKIICANWTRNCFNETSGTAKCDKCLQDDRDKENNARQQVNVFNNILIDKGVKQCHQCLQTLPINNFKYKEEIVSRCNDCRIKNRSADARYKATDRCKEFARLREKTDKYIEKRKTVRKLHPEWARTARDNARKKDLIGYLEKRAIEQRNRRNKFPEKYMKDVLRYETNPSYRFDTYKRASVQRKIEFNLTLEQSSKMFYDSCFYCGQCGTDQHLNGIDRIFNDVGYEETNCVSCCKICNNIKYILEPSNFIYIVHHILNNLKIINTNESYPEFFENVTSVIYSDYKYKARCKNLPFELSKDDFCQLTNKPCYVCGKVSNSTHTNGVDRYNNSFGYTHDNVNSCCKTCNFMKKDLTYENFIDKLVDIYYNNLLFDDIISSDICCITNDNTSDDCVDFDEVDFSTIDIDEDEEIIRPIKIKISLKPKLSLPNKV